MACRQAGGVIKVITNNGRMKKSMIMKMIEKITGFRKSEVSYRFVFPRGYRYVKLTESFKIDIPPNSLSTHI